jgi:hypothetical protein
MEKYILPKANIYRVDETGISTVQKSQTNLGPKGRKQVGAAISCEGGKEGTTVCSACDLYSTNANLFKGAKIPQLQRNDPVLKMEGMLNNCSSNCFFTSKNLPSLQRMSF